jgi:hypothetical protein
MKCKAESLQRMMSIHLVIIVIAFLTTCSFAWAQVQNTNNNLFYVFPPDSKPYGLTYGEWSGKWWKWALEIPGNATPMLDKAGEYCDQNQSGPVWFLAGTQGGPAQRRCTIPEGNGIFFPIVNVLASYVENPLIKTEQELREFTKDPLDSVTLVEASVDGVKLQDLEKHRMQSPLFNFTYPENNSGGITPGPTQAISDGYWVMLHPLSAGEHTIQFRGAVVDPTTTGSMNFVTDVIYHLTILGSSTNSTTTKMDPNTVENITNGTIANTQDAQGQQQQPLMLEGTSSSGKFRVQVNWTSNDIGAENTFSMRFFDAGIGKELSNTTYSIMIFKGQERLSDTYRENQKSAQQTYTFHEQGRYTLRIENMNGTTTEDRIDLPIQITPEFPIGMSTLMMTSATVLGMLAIRVIILSAGRSRISSV